MSRRVACGCAQTEEVKRLRFVLANTASLEVKNAQIVKSSVVTAVTRLMQPIQGSPSIWLRAPTRKRKQANVNHGGRVPLARLFQENGIHFFLLARVF